MKKYNSRLLLVFFIVIISLSSCNNDPLDIDISDIDLTIELIRLDEAVFEKNWKENSEANLELADQYGDYYDFYIHFILNNPQNQNNEQMQLSMLRFAMDPTMRLFYEAESELFGEERFHPYLIELEEAFKRFNYYFPNEDIPSIILYQSGFNYKIVPNDTLLGIGLEWYIGSDNKLIRKLSNQAFPEFEKRKMQSEYLVVDAVKGFLKVKYQGYEQMDNLLSVMVFYGKILYLTDDLLPNKKDALKMNYSNAQWEWLQKNEKEIWTYLAENNLLFSNNLRLITQWVNDGPFTTGLPQESTSRAGIYMGWQLVKQYMEKHPDTSMEALIKMKDYNKFLSAYKPKK